MKDITKLWIDLNKELKNIDPPKAVKERNLGKIRVSDIVDYFNMNLVVPKGTETHDSVLTQYKAILLPPVLPNNAKKKMLTTTPVLKFIFRAIKTISEKNIKTS